MCLRINNGYSCWWDSKWVVRFIWLDSSLIREGFGLWSLVKMQPSFICKINLFLKCLNADLLKSITLVKSVRKTDHFRISASSGRRVHAWLYQQRYFLSNTCTHLFSKSIWNQIGGRKCSNQKPTRVAQTKTSANMLCVYQILDWIIEIPNAVIAA